MSQIDEGVLPGADEGQGDIDDVKLVPVGESIRYRSGHREQRSGLRACGGTGRGEN